MATLDTHWSLGVIIGGPILILLALCGLGLMVWGFFTWLGSRDSYSSSNGFLVMLAGAGFVVFLAITAALPVIGYYPYAKEYHQWQDTSGTIDHISSRFISAGDKGGTNQRFVVQFTDGRVRSCDDTRCALLKPGDLLTLSCKRHWQYAATPGYDCNFVDSTRPPSLTVVTP